jgi:hypothetical protein
MNGLLLLCGKTNFDWKFAASVQKARGKSDAATAEVECLRERVENSA